MRCGAGTQCRNVEITYIVITNLISQYYFVYLFCIFIASTISDLLEFACVAFSVNPRNMKDVVYFLFYSFCYLRSKPVIIG